MELDHGKKVRRSWAVWMFVLAVAPAFACSSQPQPPFEEVREVDGLVAVAAERVDGTVERVRIVTEKDVFLVHDSEKGPALRERPGRRVVVRGRVYEVEGVKTIVVTDFETEN